MILQRRIVINCLRIMNINIIISRISVAGITMMRCNISLLNGPKRGGEEEGALRYRKVRY
jgi:hypothetical protein